MTSDQSNYPPGITDAEFTRLALVDGEIVPWGRTRYTVIDRRNLDERHPCLCWFARNKNNQQFNNLDINDPVGRAFNAARHAGSPLAAYENFWIVRREWDGVER